MQAHRHLLPLENGFQLFTGKEEKALWRIELTSDGKRDKASTFQKVRLRFTDDPCLGRIHKDPSEAMPDALARGSLAVFPGPDDGLFAHVTDARMELFIHWLGSVLSSRANRSATSRRWRVGSGIWSRGSRSDSVLRPERTAY